MLHTTGECALLSVTELGELLSVGTAGTREETQDGFLVDVTTLFPLPSLLATSLLLFLSVGLLLQVGVV